MVVMSLFHFLPFSEILLFQDIDVSSELLHEAMDAGVLNREKVVNVYEMISECDLILIVGFIKIFVKHLYKCFFGV